MLSKSQISFVNALHVKKNRKDLSLFLVEGVKSISEFLNSAFIVESIYCSSATLIKFSKLSPTVKFYEITDAELKKISTLTTPQDAVAIIRIPEKTPLRPESFKDRFTIILDGIQDPGNMGTIIRTADWFGFSEIICSEDTVEVYNPKVVQASMGSLSRVAVHYTDLSQLVSNSGIPVYGTLLAGVSIYETSFTEPGFIVLGNEGKGISYAVIPLITNQITIPRFGNAESLNVAISAAIVCSEIKRRGI
ncbi:RNA methyltransferase, TrmH family [Arcticibacter svalbardensis MN12-7]|uniref:RNA methyltransferase, TrmH family n=1 Tax=Arcticibacter svalbardensis MN12-7 TaxID=1150600 RepID=R9H147_9SPHI|nr:RNA methyltransferase, TrmH family [Arcticibacter svalbardensis MN12-7]